MDKCVCMSVCVCVHACVRVCVFAVCDAVCVCACMHVRVRVLVCVLSHACRYTNKQVGKLEKRTLAGKCKLSQVAKVDNNCHPIERVS